MIKHAMLMAAGLGTRLRPFTDLEPKAFLPLMGVPMIQLAVDALAEAGVRKTALNIHHHAVRSRKGISLLDHAGLEIEISDESDLLLGSAGGIRKAEHSLGGGAFFLVNADTVCDVDLRALALRHAELRRDQGVWLTLTVFEKGPSGGKYREILHDSKTGLMSGLGEPAEGRPFFVGAAVLEPEALTRVPMSGPAEFVPSILEPALAAGKVGVFASRGLWYDIGNSRLWLDAHLGMMQAIESGSAPARWKNRVEKHSRCVKPGIWTDRAQGPDVSGWKAPAYWAPLSSADQAPQTLGPDAVVYGKADQALSNVISYAGVSVSRA